MNAGDRVRVERADQTHEGVLMPSTTSEHLVVKLEGGYNVGLVAVDADVVPSFELDDQVLAGRRGHEDALVRLARAFHADAVSCVHVSG